MKKSKGTIWTEKPNFKKMMKERRERKLLEMITFALCGLLLWYIFFK